MRGNLPRKPGKYKTDDVIEIVDDIISRAELVAHYEALGREAEKRRLRAEWREARWKLASRRRLWIEREQWEVRDSGGHDEVVEEREEDGGLSPPLVSSPEDKPAPAAGGGHQLRARVAETAAESLSATARESGDNEWGPTHPPSVPMVIRQHAPPSTIGDLIHYGMGVADHTHSRPTTQTQNYPPLEIQIVSSSRGQAPPTTIQHLLYNFTTEEATPPKPSAPPTIGDFPCAPAEPYSLSFPQLGG